MSKKEDDIIMEGKVVKVLKNANYEVELENGHTLKAYLSGRMRTNYIRITLHDIVKVAISPYDLTRGRIIFRGKEAPSNNE